MGRVIEDFFLVLLRVTRVTTWSCALTIPKLLILPRFLLACGLAQA